MLNQIKCDPCLMGYQDTYVDPGGTVGFLGSWVKAGNQHGWVMGRGPHPLSMEEAGLGALHKAGSMSGAQCLEAGVAGLVQVLLPSGRGQQAARQGLRPRCTLSETSPQALE